MVKTIKIADIRRKVEEYNENLLLKDSEKILDVVFFKDKNKYTEIQKFILVDRIWFANALRYNNPKATKRRLKEIESYLAGLQEKIKKYENKKLEELPCGKFEELKEDFKDISCEKFTKNDKKERI